MRPLALALCVTHALVGCKEDAAKPAPRTLTDAAIGHYCGMMLTEHDGPKGQILLKGQDEPVWFSSARDTVAFTLLPEESKDIAAIYVSDMGAAVTGQIHYVDAGYSAIGMLAVDSAGESGALLATMDKEG